MTAESEGPTEFAGRRVAFVGKLGSMSRREAHRLVRQAGGTAVDRVDETVDLIVIGADELPIADDNLLDDSVRDATAEGRIEVISETQFWQRLGVVESERHVRRLYTPAMLAHLLGVSVAVIRRWHRRGLIVPVREIHRLPYFDFQEVATARRLAELLAAGATPQAIERKLEQLTRLVPDVDRPLAQLSVIVEGRQLLLRQGEGLIEPGGQMRLDFSAAEQSEADAATESPSASSVISMDQVLSKEQSVWSLDEMESQAAILEDTGRFTEAIEMYRAALVAGGPSAEICFRLAELLYLTGDVSAARERYSMAVELDEDYVEVPRTWAVCSPKPVTSSSPWQLSKVRCKLTRNIPTFITTWCARWTASAARPTRSRIGPNFCVWHRTVRGPTRPASDWDGRSRKRKTTRRRPRRTAEQRHCDIVRLGRIHCRQERPKPPIGEFPRFSAAHLLILGSTPRNGSERGRFG